MSLTASKTTISELRRSGAATSAELSVFDWTSASHASMQDDLEYDLVVKTGRRVLPGSDQVVEHAMSATWDPFQFSGEWDDKFAGAGFAWATYLAFAQMVGRMPLVRLQLDEHSWVGLLTNLKIKYRTKTKIHYQCTLSPHANEAVGQFRGKVPTVHETRSPDQWAQDVGSEAESLQNSLDTARQLQVRTEDVQDAIAQLGEMTDALTRIDSVINGGGLLTNATTQLLQLAAAFRRVHGAGINISVDMAQQRSDLTVAFTDVLQTLGFDTWRCTAYVTAQRAAGLARKAELDMRARAALKPRAIYRPQAGEAWERIALRFYGNGDSWRFIYDANPQVQSLVLDGTEQLIIPERAS